MKKTLAVLILFILFNNSAFAEENYFYLDNPIDGIYTMMDKVTKVAANYVKPVRKVDTNEYVYCVTPGIAINANGNYEKIVDSPWNTLNISKEKYEKIQVISYFGFMYKNHTDLKWYAVTQYLIWQEVLPDGWSVYFTNTLRGERTYEFDWMINELNSLVNSYYLNPNISPILEGSYNNNVTIYDSQNTLHNYKSNDQRIIISNDSLILRPSDNNYSFTIDYQTDNRQSNLYTYNNAQWVISRGTLPSKSLSYNVVIPKGSLKINKSIGNLNELDFNYDISLANAKYKVFNDNFYAEYMTDTKGNIYISNLNIDSYYVKEIVAPKGFDLDNNLYRVDVLKDQEISINLSDNLILSKIDIIKKYLDVDSNEYLPEENATFGIKDENENIILTNNTNIDGKTDFKLPTGIYTIFQISGMPGYEFIRDEEIEILNNNPIFLSYINYPIYTKVEDNPEYTDNNVKPEEIELSPFIENPNIDETIEDASVTDSNIIADFIEDNSLKVLKEQIINPRTNDKIYINLLFLVTSIILLNIVLLKKLRKKKEIEEK